MVEYAGQHRNRPAWWARCDCGGIIKAVGFDLRQGQVTRCSTCGHGDAYNLYGSGYSTLYGKYRSGARRRGIEMLLTEREFMALVLDDCHYCGAPPRRRKVGGGKAGSQAQEVLASGVDRLDANGPYSPENCVPCCSISNIAKNTLGHDEFIDHCRRIAERWENAQ